MSLHTPIYNLDQFPDVYIPSEDTFLFLDAIESDYLYLKNLQPSIAIEIGSGSGVIISALHQLFQKSCSYFATDINQQCCLASKLTSTLNNTHVECITMNLLHNFRKNMFDVILFNPPYVVTEPCELSGEGLNRSWAGGCNGTEITNELLQALPDLLSEKGACYIVLLKENKPLEIVKYMDALGFKSQMIMQRKIPGEHLFVYKFCRLDF
ncbi:methyltransferase N6AMT1 [Diorhabda carinulata]|uniref:methyltransferase N6AMT1 n=1 Tax=Diorhabda carinulata TaxID=1163345 RepID=UPI0025A07EBD|nr:methyltransferase N6AMT1 [Diorhabda carinulata]